MNARVPSQILQPALALERVGQAWDDDILRQLTEYIAIPAKSPTFAPDWAQLGLLDTVVRNAATWVEAQKVAGLRLEVVRLPGRTPVLFFEIESTEAAATQTVLMYGHLDKQPEFSGRRTTSSVRPATFCDSTQAAALRTTVSSRPCSAQSAANMGDLAGMAM